TELIITSIPLNFYLSDLAGWEGAKSTPRERLKPAFLLPEDREKAPISAGLSSSRKRWTRISEIKIFIQLGIGEIQATVLGGRRQ
ncbi:MAG: hypothetical protein ACU0DB_13205, partial [Paracoccus sp. (in: a-proteobacteria)]|uniref:hypothetical protein n=1 Tax=Paracoccus sp. TaxID=267 RepID=UPI00405872D4